MKPRTWEHHAGARVVYGDPQLTSQFDAVRRTIMTTARDGKTLQTEVREMREKMRAHLGTSIAIVLILKLMSALRY